MTLPTTGVALVGYAGLGMLIVSWLVVSFSAPSPKRVIVERYADIHAVMEQTGLGGALTVTLAASPGMPEIQRYRDIVRHYWQPENNH